MTTRTGSSPASSAGGDLPGEGGERIQRRLPGARVVEGARAHDAEPVGVGVEAGEEVRRRLGDRVRVLGAQGRGLVHRQRRRRAVDLAGGDGHDDRLRAPRAARPPAPPRPSPGCRAASPRGRATSGRRGQRGEVVDDVRAGVADERPGGGRVAQVGRARRRGAATPATTSSPAAAQARARWLAGEAAGPGDEDAGHGAPAALPDVGGPDVSPRGRRRPGARPSRGRWRRRARRRRARGAPSPAFSRRSSSPSTSPKSRWRQAACAKARPEPHSDGRSSAAGWTRSSAAVPGHVARCSAKPGERTAQRRRAPAATARRSRTARRTARRWRDAARRPAGSQPRPARPSGRAAPCRSSARRRRAGRAAAAPPTRRRRRRRRGRRGASVSRLVASARMRPRHFGASVSHLAAFARTVTSAAVPGTPDSDRARRLGSHIAPARARPRPRRQPGRLLARPGDRAAASSTSTSAWRGSAREHLPGERPGDHRRQPPLVPRPVRDRHDHPPPDLLRGQAGAVPPTRSWAGC